MPSSPSEATLRLALYLSYLRSSGIVASALAKQFPTETSWEAARNSEDFIQDLNNFSEVLADLKVKLLMEDPEEASKLIANNYDVAVDAVRFFAEKYQIPVEDFVYVLMHG